MPKTPNHEYEIPDPGSDDWHVPLNSNIEAFDTDVEVRDTKSNQSNYDPKAGAKFVATDTEEVFVGDGSAWKKLSTTGKNPRFQAATVDGPLTVNDAVTADSLETGGFAAINGSDPGRPLEVGGDNNWDLSNDDGDVRIGDDSFRLAIGVSLGGAGKGTSRLRAKGGVQQLKLGAGNNDTMKVEPDHAAVDGNLGVGTDDPGSRVHVVGSASGPAGPGQRGLDNHVMSVHNTDTGGANVLDLKLGAADGISDEPTPGKSNNYVTFRNGEGKGLGAIEAVQSRGDVFINFKSDGRDYAEYMARLDPDETIEAGEVVGVYGDAVTKDTDSAQRAMAVSDRAIVTGNRPPADEREQYETVGFVGRLPVKVRGVVEAGDVVVPSGEGDGVAVAVDRSEWTPGEGLVVGQAWESDDSTGVSRVTTAIGIDGPELLESALESHRQRIDDLQEETDRLRELRDRQAERIDDLEAENAALRDRLDALEARVDGLGGEGATAHADD
jgi:hypothetical protein